MDLENASYDLKQFVENELEAVDDKINTLYFLYEMADVDGEEGIDVTLRDICRDLIGAIDDFRDDLTEALWRDET